MGFIWIRAFFSLLLVFTLAKAEIPGMKKEDLDINISDSHLTIKGEKEQEEEIKKKGYYYSERSYGSFMRTIELPKDKR